MNGTPPPPDLVASPLQNGESAPPSPLPPEEVVDDDDEERKDASDSTGLSKRALKRLKKREMWEATRAQRRAAERQRRKKRSAEDRQRRLEDPDGGGETFNEFRKRLKKNKMTTSACKVTVVIDCGWEHLMELKDVQKLAKQIQYSYTTNRRLEDPLQFFVTGLTDGGMLKGKLDKDYAGYENWDIYRKSENYDQCFEKERVVYLTSESENVLEKLDESKVYVIGGLVDHNQHKGVCHSTAVSRGFSHARLPIDEFMEMKTRKVLTVNHVFDILASASTGADWKDAFLAAIPSRKGAVVKEEEETLAEEEEETLAEEEEENTRAKEDRLGDEEERKAGEANDLEETEENAEKDVD